MSPRAFGHEPINFRALPPAIRALMIANAAVFLLSGVVGDQFFSLFGLVPARVVGDRWLWQPLTYLFIHGGFMHLLFNLFALWMFGVPVETQWGPREFLKYYFICGLGAAALTVLISPHSPVPVIGASVPIYGLLVAFAMLYPDAVVYLYFLFPVKAGHMAILFGAIEFFASANGGTPGIARYAHLGGMVTGYLYIRWWWVVKLKGNSLWRRLAAAPEARPPRAQRRPAKVADGRGEGGPESPMEEIDRILDKILVSGLESLTDEEREVMRRYSRKAGGNA
jgi:membrane associated rhomboid family serine protease